MTRMKNSHTYRNPKYFFSLLPGIVVIFGNLMGGWWGISNFIFSIGILALIEWFAPEVRSNESSSNTLIPNIVLILHVVIQILAFSSIFYSIYFHQFSFWQLYWAAISVGIHSGSSSIVVAHEMIHRKNRTWKWLGKFLLFTAGNVYFFIEHLRVHHKWVGTDKDPASAKYNESLYHFYIRTTWGQFSHSLKIETERLKSENSFPYGPKNYVIQNLLLLIILCLTLFYNLGTTALAAFVIQAIVANFLLEYTNYIEHYGLSRKENEKVNEKHSWQSDKVISRFFLIDLSRHSDHHSYASKPFHQLNSLSGSPVLPTGYVTSIYLALIPPLWFYVVNKRIAEFNANQPRP